ncbi:MAG: signal peptidase I [Planctomycetes bacterium]|nr:signal peptidase I [Planctomycetota bacterium]
MIHGKEYPGNPFPSDKPEPSVEGEQAEARYIEKAEVGNTEPVSADSGWQQEEESSGPVKNSRRFRGLLKNAVVEVVVLVVLAFALAMTTKTYVVEAYEIKGRSMVPTFDDGQRVVVLKLFSDIQRGDIVIFSSQDDPGKDLIKRVIALPGERIQIRKGIVRINGKVLKEGYLEDKDYGLYDAEIDEEVGLGQLYVLGDNRDDSHDSRRFGSVSEESLKGKVVVRWWPFHEVKTF